ncbi:MAG TPA: heparan-alpha-glucosaminide N-acetyltransferase domain-containing protein [bacterium]|nr:heparan-alpha-glucosaminide N-acetyltransferase domain-containing protein [bacterium]HNS34158.1 heparan-alpha-glucosaminide N-acetyltransferase domain-containing protein [bacterium]HNZ73140.1 heparan-alpha-glucosaminide N-acetyltransferase domain-containing protein [bacterium]HOH67283.1 heparan-alpha-glucosaminide N-acetyltransferase domain-containing protein [bacterium]
MSDSRLKFLDGLRGVAIVLMVFNHTARWLFGGDPLLGNTIIYFTVSLSAPIFLFLVGFCLELSFMAARKNLTKRQLISKYLGRGLVIILLGYLFNFLVFADDSILAGKVLHCIGAAIILAIPFLYWSEREGGRLVILALALLLLFGFGLVFPIFSAWVEASDIIGKIFFSDFSLVPWFGLVLLGLIWGRAFIVSVDKQKFFSVVATIGWLLVGLFFFGRIFFIFGLPVWVGNYNLNGHWVPGPMTWLWVIGGVLLIFRWAYSWWEQKNKPAAGLVILGQTSLMLYFLHHLVGLSLLSQHWQWRFGNWSYWWFNLLFIILLVGAGRVWLAFKYFLKKYYQKQWLIWNK